MYASKSVSLEELEQSRADADVAQSEWNNQTLIANSAAAIARLREADLAIAQQRLKDTEIRVPIPSTLNLTSNVTYAISERLISEGTMVRTGTELFRLTLNRILKLRLAVPEANSNAIQVGQDVEIVTVASTQKVFGKVARISPSIDRATRSFHVEVEIPNPDLKLKPGSFAKASILIGTDDEVPTIPLTALDTFAGITKIFLVVGNKSHVEKVVVGDLYSTPGFYLGIGGHPGCARNGFL